jgi:DNA-binding IclR family transcriptional regulator
VDQLIVFLGGFVVGGLAMRLVMVRAQRAWMRPHQFDEQYRAARRVVQRHFMNHDTLNVRQLQRLMDINIMTAQRYLEQLTRERLVREHGHAPSGAFYTRF